ncbi:MAG TPA: SusC/RagA family TonB-linked outer membrane protein [Chitinophagaceae bacterium]|nr:SusC/RagA family TonB-linked outer membrane protein [Chitinophagaceae bacterium]
MRKILLGFAMLCIALMADSQTQLLTGKVTDATGAPIPSATIIEKGTKNGTFSAENGSFSLKVKPNAIIVVSAVGFETSEVPIEKAAVIALKSDTRTLGEVVVTGVGTATSKRKLGISVQTVTADKLPAAPTASIDQALIGKIPGAQISSISGNPGDPVNIVLRGINTIQGGTKPLILLDGLDVSTTDLNSFDLSNIDRVEVVEGAASSTIYGAQGANGVIQIFTKKGKKGKTAINFSTSYASNTFLNTGNVHKADKHALLTDANNNIIDVATGKPVEYNDVGSIEGISYAHGGAGRYYILDTLNEDNKPFDANLKYYDHFKQVFQTGNTLNNALNISGANDKSDFALTISNSNTLSPILQNGHVDRTNVTANLGTELFKGFKVRSITQVIYTRNTLHPSLGAGGGQGGLGGVGRVYGFLNTSPFFDLTRKLADGTYPLYQTADFLSVNSSNPYYQTEYSRSDDNKIDIVQSFDANYSVNRFVELDAKYGIDYQNRNIRYTYYNQSENLNSIYYEPNYIGIYAPDNTGEIDNWQYNTTNQNFLASGYFRTDFERDFHIKLPITTSTQVAFDYRKDLYKEYGTYGVGLPLEPPINITATSSQAVSSDYVQPFITYGYLVNQKIDFGDYGGITGGFRSDWSSAFGGGSKAFIFPHFDGYFQVNSLFKNSHLGDVLSLFKVRAAYGEAGIQPGPFDRYPVLNQQNLGSSLIYTIPGNNNNPDLGVEVSKEFETGIDFAVNTNKGSSWLSLVSGEVTYWKRKSQDVIYPVNVQPSTGSTGLLTNAMDLSSHGFEFGLNISMFNSKNFKWDLTTNFSNQTSMVDDIKGGADIILNSAAGDAALVLTPGHKIGQIYGYKALTSLDYTRQDGTRYIAKEDEGFYTIVDGRVVDKRTYQIQFTDEKYPLGDPNPKFNMSFINSFSYKDILAVSFQFDWVNGSHLYNQTKEWMYRDGISGDFTKPVTINGRTGAWTAYWSSPYYNLWGSTHGAGNLATKDFFYEDASFLRLRNVSLMFDIAKVVKVPYISKLQLVLTGRNILTVTKYTGYDPEVSSGAVNSGYDRGVDHNTLPNIKSYEVGLNVGF